MIRSRALSLALVLAWGGVARAADPPRVSASAFAAPPGGGWSEVTLVLESGPRAWRGVVEVAGGVAKAHVRLALPEHGQRVVRLPFWVEEGERSPRVWIDGAPAGTVVVPSPAGGGGAIVLVAERDASGASPAGAGEASGAARAPLARLPESWGSYGAFDLVILPPGGEAALRPAQSAALQRWVRWGGAVALLEADRLGPAAVREVGSGVAIAAGGEAEARAAFARRRPPGPEAGSFPVAALRAWERARPPGEAMAGAAGRPGARLGLAAAAYAGLLLAAALAAAWLPGARRHAAQALAFLACAAALAAWGIARAGEPWLIEAREIALIRALPDGGPTHLHAVLRARALRSGDSRFVPLLEAPQVIESEASRAPANPHRAVRWDPDGDVWERRWALGETATLRVGGGGPALGVRARPVAGSQGWDVENGGRHMLRRAVLVAGDGRMQALADIPPGARVRVAAGAAGSAGAQPDESALAFWAALLPGRGAWESGSPALVADLDPPIASLRFADGEARVSGESHLVMALPEAGAGRGR